MDRPLITAVQSESYKSLDQMNPMEQAAFADAMRPGAVVIPSGTDSHLQVAHNAHLDAPMIIDRGFDTQRQTTMRDMLTQAGVRPPQQQQPAPLYGQPLPQANYDMQPQYQQPQPPQYQPAAAMGQPVAPQPMPAYQQPVNHSQPYYPSSPPPMQGPSSLYQQAAQPMAAPPQQQKYAGPQQIPVLFELPNREQFPATYLDVLPTESGQLILVSSASPGAPHVYMPRNPDAETACRVQYPNGEMLYLLVPTGVIFEHNSYRYCILIVKRAMPYQPE